MGGAARPRLAALVRQLRHYPWRQWATRLLVPAQCTICILVGLALIRRGDMIHMLAGGLLVTAFVLMAVVYTWMLYHPPQTHEETAPADEAPAPVVAASTAAAIDPTVTPPDTLVMPDATARPRRRRAPSAKSKTAATPPLANDMLPGL